MRTRRLAGVIAVAAALSVTLSGCLQMFLDEVIGVFCWHAGPCCGQCTSTKRRRAAAVTTRLLNSRISI